MIGDGFPKPATDGLPLMRSSLARIAGRLPIWEMGDSGRLIILMATGR
jgi:hypothetical protein